MIAADPSVLVSLPQTELSATPSMPPSLSCSNIDSTGLSSLTLFQANCCPPGFVDYWQQHALCMAVPHFSVTLVPQVLHIVVSLELVVEETGSLHALQMAWLTILNALLIHESKPLVIIFQSQQLFLTLSLSHQTGLWLAQIQGIRSGPASLI